jgi:Flp pilus assembly protein TadG
MARRPILGRLPARFRRSDSGLAAIETALFAPLLALLLLGGYDLARYVSIRSSVDKVGFSVADVTSQYRELTDTAMRQVFMVTAASMPTYTSGTNGVTVLTSIYLDRTTPKVKWQCYSTTGTNWSSKVGTSGGTAAVNAALLADTNDNLMVAEVFYQFKPLLSTFFKSSFTIYTSSIYRPRLGTLTTKPDQC